MSEAPSPDPHLAPLPGELPLSSPGFAAVDRTVGGVCAALNVLGTLLILGLAVLVNVDVIGRAAFGAPVSGVPEIVSLSIVAIVFLQAAQAARAGRFIRSDALLRALARRAPRAAAWLDALWHAAALALIWIVAQASWPLFLKAWDRDEFVGAVGDFTAPVWPVKAVLLVGCGALMAQFALGLVRAVAAGLRRAP
ncbi:MAG: TRAP transporter small permease subunit [Pseudomonadota bacterium]